MSDTKVFIAAINEYAGTGMNLNGCHNDSAKVFNLLTKYGRIDPSKIRTAVDSEATAADFRQRLKWMVENRTEKAATVWTYSGHGSRKPDTTGTEANGYTEFICGYDTQYNWDGQVDDDEVWKYFCLLPQSGRVLALFDCCHSGTMYRTAGNGVPVNPSAANRNVTLRFVPYKGEKRNEIAGRPYPKSPANRFLVVTSKGAVPLPPYIHIDEELPGVYGAGCDDNEYSAELSIVSVNGVPAVPDSEGLFMKALDEVYGEYPGEPLIQTAERIYNYIRKYYPSIQQTPQWWVRSRELDRALFDFSEYLPA